jgi:endonuclease YncB( thermonuclease family)
MLKSGLLACGLLLVAQTATAERIRGLIVAVSDGDTVTLLDSQNKQHRIRLVGVDAPEKAQPFGKRSRAELSSLIFGKRVEADCSKRDRYGRELCKILIGTTDINLTQVQTGMAWWYRNYAKEQSISDQSAYEDAESAARAHQVGLWSDQNPVPPWLWRRSSRDKSENTFR